MPELCWLKNVIEEKIKCKQTSLVTYLLQQLAHYFEIKKKQKSIRVTVMHILMSDI